MNIAITGATGFIGSSLVRNLFNEGHTVFAFGRKVRPKLLEYESYTQWDIRSGPIMVNEAIEVVIHCAGAVSDWGSYKDMYEVNVIGTKNVLASFSKVKQFIFISSASIYGSSCDLRRIAESNPYPSNYPNSYGLTKMLAEKEVVAFPRQNKVILRPRAVYGAGDTTLTPRILKARRSGRIMAIGDGRNHLSLTHVDNLALAIKLVMQREFSCEVFNIADDLTPTLDEVLRALLRAYSLPAKITYLNKDVALRVAQATSILFKLFRARQAPLLTPYAVLEMSKEGTLDITKAKQVLEFKPNFSYREGFQEMAKIKEKVDGLSE